MTSADLTLFLPQVGVILGVTVVLGRIGRALKLPALVGTTTHAAEMIGMHAVFGAFLAGIGRLPRHRGTGPRTRRDPPDYH